MEFPDMPDIDKAKIKEYRRKTKNRLNLAKTFGMPNYILFHMWNWFMILYATFNVMLYYTEEFGHEESIQNRGWLSTAIQVYITVPIALFYFISLCAGATERCQIITWLFKMNIIAIVIVSVCFLIDAFLFIYNKHAFCNLQLENPLSCDDRNSGFLIKVLLFFVIWIPLWFACANATRRFARELIEELKDKSALMSDLDAAGVEREVRHFMI